jgi:hypothetical protein
LDRHARPVTDPRETRAGNAAAADAARLGIADIAAREAPAEPACGCARAGRDAWMRAGPTTTHAPGRTVATDPAGRFHRRIN